MLYIIPAVYLCSGAPPSANGHDRPGSSTASQVYVWLLYKKNKTENPSKISEQSMLLVCRDYCGATPLLQDHITGLPTGRSVSKKLV